MSGSTAVAVTTGIQPVRVWLADLGPFRPGPAAAARRRAERRRLLERAVAIEAGRPTRIVRRCLQCGQDDHGRPVADGQAFDINATSCGRWAFFAVSAERVGIDAASRQQITRPVTSVLTTAEVAALVRRPAEERADAFIPVWAAKEAVAKADGRGLALPLESIETADLGRRDGGRGSGQVVAQGTPWQVRSTRLLDPEGSDVWLAVAARRTPEVEWRSLPAADPVALAVG